MRIIDRHGTIVVIDRGMPEFPAALEERAELARYATTEQTAADDFFAWYAHQCSLHNLRYPTSGTPEDRVHLRRLRAKMNLEKIKRIAIIFLEAEADKIRGGYHHHLRLLVARLDSLLEAEAQRIG